MKIVIEALGLNAGGGKGIAINVLSRLQEHARHQFVLLVPDLPDYAQIGGSNIRTLRYRVPESLLDRHRFLSRTVPDICRAEHANVLLGLGNYVPKKLPCAAAVLLHNPYVVYQEPIVGARLTPRQWLIMTYARHLYRRLPKSVRVIVATETMRTRFISQYSRDPDSVTVIPHACYLPKDAGYEKARLNGRGSAFTFVCIGAYMPYKNLEILLPALQRLSALTSRPVKCLINIDERAHPGARKLLQRVAEANLQAVLCNVGRVSENKLIELYRDADAFIHTSLMETYGFTYDEAMQFGVPILASDRDFAHDRCRDAALYFDPLGAGSLARAMWTVMADDGVRSRLVEKGRDIVRQMPTWGEIVTRFIAVLESAAREPRTGEDVELNRERARDDATQVQLEADPVLASTSRRGA